MFRNFIVLFFTVFSYAQLNAQITFNSTSEVISYLEGEWCPKVTCGGFVSSPCQPISGNNGYLLTVYSPIATSSDSVLTSIYNADSMIFSKAAYVSFLPEYFGGIWSIDLGSGSYRSFIRTDYMSTSDSLALEIDGSDTPTIIYARTPETSIAELIAKEKKVEVFPNPVMNTLRVDIGSETIISKVSIWDTNGRMVSLWNNLGKNIDVSQLESGVYFMKFSDGRDWYTSRFVKI
ncbi:MAG: T9SS type A sorting domain-containing protein [Saprospiraceae bacterium]|nr:T9SS type A sorting domain-containing protein [Saprospiraceae bacterium]